MSNRNTMPPKAICENCQRWENYTSFFAKFGLQGRIEGFANGLG